MTTDRTKPLRVGQVLKGLLENGANAGGDEETSTLEASSENSSASATSSSPALPVAIWERMMAAVDMTFDGDNDGDVRGKG